MSDSGRSGKIGNACSIGRISRMHGFLRYASDMMARFIAASLSVLLLASAPAAASGLVSVQVHLGMADIDAIGDGSKALPLIEPTVEIKPAFSPEIDFYALQVPDGVDGITLVLEGPFRPVAKLGVLDVNGVRREIRGLTYSSAIRRIKGVVIPLQLEPADTRIRFGSGGLGRDVKVYELLVTRGTERSGEATLVSLALSRGVLEPSFRNDVHSYRTRVAGHGVALSAQMKPHGSVSVQGIGPGGKLLETDGLVVLGLGTGENAIIVSVTGREGSATRHYLIRAEASEIVREVSVGDLISIPDDCDDAVGCDGMLNGVKGRLACGRGRVAANASDAGSPDDAACSMSVTLDGDVARVDSAAG